ncbi:MAG: hypothetical protein K1X95_15795 [Acidimicrobiia bacterium]|nr:hypothetical protein [Acidimicrobiia bacterium]
MHTLRRIAVSVVVALTTLVLSGTAALAQTPGTDTVIPEASPKNWGWQFVGVPVFVIVIALGLVFWAIYMLIIVRLRYPRKRQS